MSASKAFLINLEIIGIKQDRNEFHSQHAERDRNAERIFSGVRYRNRDKKVDPAEPYRQFY